MLPSRSHIRMNHRVNILKRTTTENDMGQAASTWAVLVMETPCFATPSGASTSVRVYPTVEEADYLTVYMPHDALIDYTVRLSNIETVTGETIYYGPFQIIQIDKAMSFSGRPQYLQLVAKSVIE